jgi:uncharacterized protein (DUF1919 family)
MLQWPGKTYLKNQLEGCKFSIISNDCFGAEMYRWIDKPYNTPFIGLMVMAPCYIELIKNFEHNILQPLSFTKSTRYPEMEDFRHRRNNYPIGLINEAEIHFLHYHSEMEAYDKWNRRRDKIDFNNLRFKFCLDKDFATLAHLQTFDELRFPFKLCLGEQPISGFQSFAHIPGLPFDGAAAFRHSLQYVNIAGWLKNGNFRFENKREEMMGQFLYRSLKR